MGRISPPGGRPASPGARIRPCPGGSSRAARAFPAPDGDATYERALAAGAESLQEPIQKDDEDKRGGVRDAGGTTWWIATRVG